MKDTNTTTKQKPSLQATLDALKSVKDREIPTATLFYGLSGLTHDEVKQVESVWKTLVTDYRQKILELLTETSETNFELDYRSIGFLGLTDPDPPVRQAAIDVLWEDESLELMRVLMHMAKADESNEVRATAASALGRFILQGELGELPENETAKALEVVIALWKNEQEDLHVRRRALEALSNSSHDLVTGAIKAAYESDERMMKISAIFAMGRSYDSKWEKTVLRELDNPDPEIRFEAVRSSGELELQAAVPKLIGLMDETDREILEMAIWALGEIGGREAIRVLEHMMDAAEEEEDAELIEAIDDAIGNASLIGGDLIGDYDED